VASLEDKTARAEAVVLAHSKPVVAALFLAIVADAIKVHFQEKLLEWAIKHLGEPLGTWLVRNPTSIITVSSLLLLLGLVVLFISSPKRSVILQPDETPFVNTKSRRMLLLWLCVVAFVISGGEYFYFHRKNRVTQRRPDPPTLISAAFSAESPMTMSEGNIVPISAAASVCSDGSKVARGLKGIESLPGGPSLHEPKLMIDGHRIRIQTSSLDPEHLQLFFEIEVTNRGESSIAKDWRLCLSQDGKHAEYFEAQDFEPQKDIKASLADATLQSPIEHGRTAKGWLLFVLPKDQDLHEFTGSVQCRDYLEKRSFLIFMSKPPH